MMPKAFLSARWVTLCLTFSFSFLLLSGQPLDLDRFSMMKARSIGPAGMSGRVTAIDVVLSNPDIIYVGTASGGLWKSTSGGIDWEPLFDEERVASIGAVAIDPQNPAVIWAGTGEGNPRNSQTSGAGIYKSLDGGRTWQLMGLERTRNIHRVIVHPRNPEVVYVAAIGSAWGEHPERGVYRTRDGGKTWEKVLYIDEKTGCADLVIDPTNPNKLIAAMWEYRRWPWFFNSGGPGSGLFITHDGGDSWEERTATDGLPEGDLGRIGLAIAPSRPERIYAWVESKKNALYRSDDGGFSWKMINDSGDIGNRPFYYADIFVDPKNENRVYSLYSMVSRSEDGGKSFQVIIPYSGVHPDHHAFWVHPEDPDFLIEGNDGGLAISRDMGESWRFVENLPLAQFYHINVDMETPYNVYGGMQDNGSWRGPAYLWKAGGIRNGYWQELFFGDGFDVLPDPAYPNRYGYAMSQGGYLGRYDLQTGYNKFIRPIHPKGEKLRFNWNAAIAQDPFEEGTLYYGSQFVHKSTDRGDSWEIISPDLTTNDPEKQQQMDSGGLTYDDTGAENFTTIIAIAPSPVEQGLIWVGTDDGNLQLTRDGGNTWTLLSGRLPGMPAGSWIPQIHPSNHAAGEAFVVANNYRRDDWQPYVYHTVNFGQSWTRITREDQVWGYALSIVQDPIAPQLLFLGTEFGLYVSIDTGKNWQKWTHGYPTVSTMDLKIHPREHDLVIGTFGRAAYVLDDIRPIREVALEGTQVLEKPLHVFDPPTAVLAAWQQAPGTRFAADAIYAGENRPDGAMITFHIAYPEGDTLEEAKVNIEVFDAEGEKIRTLTHEPDTGINRIYWGLEQKGVRYPGSPKPKKDSPEPGGVSVLPGTYKIKLTFHEASDSTALEVIQDPRLNLNLGGLEQLDALRKRVLQDRESLTLAVDRIDETQKTLDQIETQIPEGDTTYKTLREAVKTMRDSLDHLRKQVLDDSEVQGIRSDDSVLNSRLGSLTSYILYNRETPGKQVNDQLERVEADIDSYLERVNRFFREDFQTFRQQVEAAALSPFAPEYPDLKR